MTSTPSNHGDRGDVIVTTDDSSSQRVVIIDDHQLFASLLEKTLAGETLDVVGVFTGDEAGLPDTVADLDPDLVLLDLHLGPEHTTSIPLIGHLVATDLDVVMLTASDERLEYAACLEAGASGIIKKSQSLDELRQALGDALAGKPLISSVDRMSLMIDLRLERETERSRRAPFERLTKREAEVLEFLCDGHSAAEIAELSFVSLATVRSQIRSILSKLDVSSQLAAVGLARRCGWLDGR